MATVFVHLNFRDYDTWKKSFDATHDLRAGAGMTNVRPFRCTDDPNEAIVIAEADDVDRARAFFTSPEARVAFERAGLTGAPKVHIAEPI